MRYVYTIKFADIKGLHTLPSLYADEASACDYGIYLHTSNPLISYLAVVNENGVIVEWFGAPLE